MLQFNPDNYRYYAGLRRAMGLDPDASGNLTDAQREHLTQLFDSLQEQYPHSSAAKRIPLDFKVCFPPGCTWTWSALQEHCCLVTVLSDIPALINLLGGTAATRPPLHCKACQSLHNYDVSSVACPLVTTNTGWSATAACAGIIGCMQSVALCTLLQTVMLGEQRDLVVAQAVR